MNRIMIFIDDETHQRLRAVAKKERREARHQAGIIVRDALMNGSVSRKTNCWRKEDKALDYFKSLPQIGFVRQWTWIMGFTGDKEGKEFRLRNYDIDIDNLPNITIEELLNLIQSDDIGYSGFGADSKAEMIRILGNIVWQ